MCRDDQKKYFFSICKPFEAYLYVDQYILHFDGLVRVMVGKYTGCSGGNVPHFGRMFLTLKYTDITQNTFVYPKLNGYGDNGERSLKV